MTTVHSHISVWELTNVNRLYLEGFMSPDCIWNGIIQDPTGTEHGGRHSSNVSENPQTLLVYIPGIIDLHSRIIYFFYTRKRKIGQIIYRKLCSLVRQHNFMHLRFNLKKLLKVILVVLMTHYFHDDTWMK